MDLKFTPKSAVADSTVLATISAAIEENNAIQKQQTLTTTLTGSRFLERLANAADATSNSDTVDIEEINKALTLAILEASFYKANLKKNLELVENLKLKIQLANSRDWYRDFVNKYHKKSEEK